MKLIELPPRVLEYIGSRYTTLKNLSLASRHRVPKEKIYEYASTLGDVFLKDASIEQLPSLFEERLGISKAQAFYLAADSAEQHFIAFEDFLGPSKEYVQQWRSWARELGARQPSSKADPVIEKMLTRVNKGNARNFEFRPRSASRQLIAKQARPVATVGQKVAKRRGDQAKGVKSATSQSDAVQASPEARQKFLGQVRSLTIESLRQPGGTAEAKLSQVAEKIQQVVASAPNERFTVSQALRNSPLFSLYQQLGQETIRTRQPIDQVIYARYQQQQPYLLKEEFDAVAELIKKVG